MKRKQSELEDSPSKRRALVGGDSGDLDDEDMLQSEPHLEVPQGDKPNGTRATAGEVTTPIKRGRGRPKGSKNTPKSGAKTVTPSKPSHQKKLFSTPTKPNGTISGDGMPSTPRNADRSARRKSVRAIIERTMGDLTSDDEETEELARHIYDVDEIVEDELDDLISAPEPESAPTTPSKRGRGRPKGSKNRKPTTPPRDLPPHELYFAQNKGAGSRTSNNNLSSLALLDHEEYFTLMRTYQDPHTDDMKFLEELHSRSFSQWQFELSQDFNICIYGWGSKRALLTKFATYLYNSQPDHESHRIVIVNGYVPNTSVRDILNTLCNAISPHPQKLGSQPLEMLETLFSFLSADTAVRITLLINSIDAHPLRRAASQTLLARIASHSQINLLASADNPNFPLLWDSSLRSSYNFVFHDCTTFVPYTAELDVVNEVHSLLGRSGRRIGGKEGVSFVLKSLPVKAKDLFRVLVAEQLATMDDTYGMFGGAAEMGDVEDDEFGPVTPRRGAQRFRGAASDVGIEYNVLYQKAAEDFICPNEMTFRTLLKEYVFPFYPVLYLSTRIVCCKVSFSFLQSSQKRKRLTQYSRVADSTTIK